MQYCSFKLRQVMLCVSRRKESILRSNKINTFLSYILYISFTRDEGHYLPLEYLYFTCITYSWIGHACLVDPRLGRMAEKLHGIP